MFDGEWVGCGYVCKTSNKTWISHDSELYRTQEMTPYHVKTFKLLALSVTPGNRVKFRYGSVKFKYEFWGSFQAN